MTLLGNLKIGLIALCVAACGGASATQEPSTGSVPVPSLPRRWVFSAGVSTYSDEHLKLAFADEDAKAIDALFASAEGGRVPDDRRKLLVNGQAKRADLLGELSRMMDRTAKEDLVIVFLSMHGVRVSERAFYLVAYDTQLDSLPFTGVRESELREALGHADAKRIVLLLDACHAGALGYTGIKGAELGVDAAVLREILSAEGEGVLSSSSAGEASKEDPALKHGLFTHYLLRGLRGEADGAGGGQKDGLITLRELFDYTYARVSADSRSKQHPDLKGADALPLVALAPPALLEQRPSSSARVDVEEVDIPLPFFAPAQPPPVAGPRQKVEVKGLNHEGAELAGIPDIEFDTAQATIKNTPANAATLMLVVLGLQQNVNITLLRVESHTDSDGDPANNQVLSERRAEAVVDFLVSHGVDRNRLRPIGCAARDPLFPNDWAEHKARNRRTEFDIETINGGRPEGYTEPCAPNSFRHPH